MPIECGIALRPISEDDFHAIDYRIMGLVFSIHKELGRFYDEKIDQSNEDTGDRR